MTTINKNPQDVLAESMEGIYLVDAGAGTGKTHSIISRYQRLIEKGIPPKEILLITFTRNAANQMREDVMEKVAGDFNVTEFLEAPILNFHSLCIGILKNFGTDSPKYIGVNEILSNNFFIIEDNYFESEFFRKFFTGFKKENEKKYKNIFLSLNDNYKAVLNIIKKLCSSGIFPDKSGWLNDGEELLKGNCEEYFKKFDLLNATEFGNSSEVQNKLHNILKNKIEKNINLDFNLSKTLWGKRTNPEIRDAVFLDESRIELIEFIRSAYHSYIQYMIKKNVLNFDFSVMLAFLILFNDDKVRNDIQFKYVMVDEFQDTDEIQFQLLMLLVKNINGNANIAVVGDWKQGIYGFRNTTIENITEFTKRLSEYKKILNAGEDRIGYDVSEEKIQKIIFEYNYRSSQKILNFSRETLLCEGRKEEEFDKERIKENFKDPLKAKRNLDDLTEINFYQTKEKNFDDEIELILKKVSELVNEDKYKIREFDKEGKVSGERRINYSDICVLSRNRSFGLKLQKAGLEKGIPVNYEGGLELFASEQGILVLAWLRLLLNERNTEAWIPILEKEGYKYYETEYMLKNPGMFKNSLFENSLDKFLKELSDRKENILFLVESILSRYKFNDEFGNAIINEICKWTKSDLISVGSLNHLIDNSKTDSFVIELNKTSDAVITQTIHSAKGLEFPVVIVANCNSRIFPDTKNIIHDIIYHPVPGLRFRKMYAVKGDYHYIYQSWKSDVLVNMFKRENYDEERRLLYVASTRAKQYLYFTSSNPSPFFTELASATEHKIIDDFDYEIKPAEIKTKIFSGEIKIPEYTKSAKKFVSVHTLMKMYDTDFNFISDENESSSFRSHPDAIEYGIRIHKIASNLAGGYDIDSEIPEVKRIKEFISGLNANEIKSEVDFLFPKENEVIRGTIDLLAFYDDRIEVIDYKTDKSMNNIEMYKIQLGIYKDVIKSIYKDKKVIGKIFFVSLDEMVEV